MTTTRTAVEPVTTITVDTSVATHITFLHVDEVDQDAVVSLASEAADHRVHDLGAAAAHVLRSLEGSRVVLYEHWPHDAVARPSAASSDALVRARALAVDDATTRVYEVVYADDRSPAGVTTISPSTAETIFINEITTRPGDQRRLLELVIANNEAVSTTTAGYRSANFHRSLDGLRAVNYSLWDSAEHCIDAISAMADADRNLEETMRIAEPDFRFYALAHSAHA